MSSVNEGRQAVMDSSQIYREETFTDRRVGTIRRLTPVTADGAVDAARPGPLCRTGADHDADGRIADQLRSGGARP